ncbi:hypothetical protein ACFLXJ_06035 [Chloroflexota bacterium]
MSKKMKVLVSVLVAVLLLTVGGTTLAMAQDEEEPAPQAEANGLLARVAEILNVPEADLVNAFEQARQEIVQERSEEVFNQALDKAVEEGLIIQDEADEIRAWWEGRPEALDAGLSPRALGLMRQNAGNLSGVCDGQPGIGQRLGQRFNNQAQLEMRQGLFGTAKGRWQKSGVNGWR